MNQSHIYIYPLSFGFLSHSSHHSALSRVLCAIQYVLTSYLYFIHTINNTKVKVAQSCPTLCHPMDYRVYGILRARILEWVAFPFSRGSSQPRDQTHVSCIASRFFTSWAPRKAHQQCIYVNPNLPIPPTSPFLPWYTYICSLHLCLYFCLQIRSSIPFYALATWWLIGKDPNAGKDWRQEKRTAEDVMVDWHHWLDGYEFEQAPEVGDGQGSQACWSPWGHRLGHNWATELIPFFSRFHTYAWIYNICFFSDFTLDSF